MNDERQAVKKTRDNVRYAQFAGEQVNLDMELPGRLAGTKGGSGGLLGLSRHQHRHQEDDDDHPRVP